MPRSAKNQWLILGAIFVIFLALRLPALHAPYHQDEYKWPLYADPAITAPGTVPHPPLTEFIYVDTLGHIINKDNFRAIPLIFSVVNFFLIFYLASILFDKKTALWTAFLFSISFYSILASVMVDVDGSIMPFFFLIMMIGYAQLKQHGFVLRGKGWRFLSFLLLGVLGGFLIKVSFAVAMAAIALDFAIEKKIFSDKRKLALFAAWCIGAAAGLVLILLGAKFIFPFFKLGPAVTYWEHFADSSSFLGRGWFQTFVEFAKSILYASPLLVLPAFLVNREEWRKTRPFFLFIFIGLFFYLIAFDFSLGALDRYFQFVVIPLSIISAAVYARLVSAAQSEVRMRTAILIALATLALFSVQFIPQAILPLYPKTEWLKRLLSLRWNFLFPLNGGSGPLPFYVSFLFLVLVWLVCLALAALSFKRLNKKTLILALLAFGLAYNLAFAEEYLVGAINGNSAFLVKDAAAFIAADPAITKVTVYNDNGGWNVMETGKYRKRLYIDPKFDLDQKIQYLNQYKEFYLVVDIPHIDPSTVYAKYFSTCTPIYDKTSGRISAFIYDCRNAPDVAILTR